MAGRTSDAPDAVRSELQAMNLPQVEIAEPGRVYDFS